MYGWVGLPTPGNLMLNARINSCKNIVICASHNELVRFIFTVFDGQVHYLQMFSFSQFFV